jgi:hypothetical protein
VADGIEVDVVPQILSARSEAAFDSAAWRSRLAEVDRNRRSRLIEVEDDCGGRSRAI